jgi:hypothetical protein
MTAARIDWQRGSSNYDSIPRTMALRDRIVEGPSQLLHATRCRGLAQALRIIRQTQEMHAPLLATRSTMR